MTHRQLLASILLLTWVFAQGSLVAHDFVAEHDIEASCEWLCQTGKQGDEDAVISHDALPVDISLSADVNQLTHSYSPNRFLTPTVRGPPRAI